MDPNLLIEAAKRKQEAIQQSELEREQAEKNFTMEQFRSITVAMAEMTKVFMDFIRQQEIKTNITNFPDKIGTPDSDKVVKAVKSLEKALKPEKMDNKDVVKAINELNKNIKSLPGKIAPTDAVEVTNIKEMTDTLAKSQKTLTDALKSLELAPKITVPKPEVHIQPTDTKGIVKALKEVKKEIIDKPVPGTPTFVQDPLIRFTPVDMDDSTTVQYYSYIATDGEFYIRKVDKSGAYTTIRFYFGKGVDDYNTAWTGRAALTYTMWAA
jgi:hypothetical protein